MKTSLILFCLLSSLLAISQDSVSIKYIYVEYSTKKPQKDKFQFAWSKKFDKSGNLLFHSSPTQYFDSIRYQYNTDNKVKRVQNYISTRNEKHKIEIINHEYSDNTVKTCKTTSDNSSYDKCKKIIKEFDDQGNLVSKLILKNDSLNIYSNYYYEEHRYEYDSLKRIHKKFSNCQHGDDCEIAEYTYGEKSLKIESRKYSTLRIGSLTNDTTYKTELYTYFPNDTIATLEIYSYSSRIQSRIGVHQKFYYDIQGNIIEFQVYGYDSGEAKLYTHNKYSYEYNQYNDIKSKVHQIILPKDRKGKFYYKYSYKYW